MNLHPFLLAVLAFFGALAAAVSARAQAPELIEPLKVTDQTTAGAPGRFVSGIIRGPRAERTAEWRDPSGNVLLSATACASNDWKSVAAGARHVLAIKMDGSLWGWGDNSAAQLTGAYGPTVQSPALLSAVDPQNPVRWEQVFASGAVSGGIRSDGSLWVWGTQRLGSEPQQIPGDFVWESASTNGEAVAAINRSGELYTLDLMNLAPEPRFRLVGGGAGWRSCVLHSSGGILAIKRDRTLWKNSLSDGEDFRRVGGDLRWRTVDAANGYYVALREDGTLWGAPLSWEGTLPGSAGEWVSPEQPVRLGTSSAWVHVAAGTMPLAVDRSGGVFWVEKYASRPARGPVGECARVCTPRGDREYATASENSLSGFALGRDNTLWAWGNNTHGQLGNFERLPEGVGFTEDRAQVGVGAGWNLPSPVLGIPVGCPIPSEGFAAGIYTLTLDGKIAGRIALQNWVKPESPGAFVHYGPVTLRETPADPALGAATSYRWLRNGTLLAQPAYTGALGANTSGVYQVESFTRLVTLPVSGTAGSDRISISNISNLQVGMAVEGTGIPPGTVITGFAGSGTVTLSGTLSAAISNGSLRFGATSRGEPRVVQMVPKPLQDVFHFLSFAPQQLENDYSLLSSGSLSNMLTMGSLRATASLLKAAVDLLSVISDSSPWVRLGTTQGESTASFVEGYWPMPRGGSFATPSQALKVGDEISAFFGSSNFPPGTRITAISGKTIRFSNPATQTGPSVFVAVSSSPARTVLRSLGIGGGLDPRPGSVRADLENAVLSGSLDTAPLKRWLLNANSALAERNPLGQLQNADALLAGITDPAFCAVIPLAVLAGPTAGAETFVVDYGDVLLMRCGVRLGMAALRWLDLQNTDLNLAELRKMVTDGSLSLQSIWEKYPSLGGPGSGKQADFETDLRAALQAYQAFSRFTNPRFGQVGPVRLVPSTLCLFRLEPGEERQFRDIVDKTLDSLNAAHATAGLRSFQLDDQQFLTLSPHAFFKRTANRADFPTFSANRYVPGSLKPDLAATVYPDLNPTQLGQIERWLTQLEPRLDRQWKTGTAASLTITNASVQAGGWITVSGTVSGAAPLGGIQVNTESASGQAPAATAIFTERARASAADRRIYDWNVQLPAPVVGGSVKITAAAANATNARESRMAERQVAVPASPLQTIPAPGSLAVAVAAGDSPETGRPADFAVLVAGSGALSYQWSRGGMPTGVASGVTGAVDDWAMVSVGSAHTAAIKRDGTLWTWGSNASGQLGIPLPAEAASIQNFPARVGTDADWVSVACSNTKTVALKRDGTLWETVPDADDFRAAKVGKMRQRSQASYRSFSLDTLTGHALAIQRDGTLTLRNFFNSGRNIPWTVTGTSAASFGIQKDGALYGVQSQSPPRWSFSSLYGGLLTSSPRGSFSFPHLGWQGSRIGSSSNWVDVKVSPSLVDASGNEIAYAVALQKDGSLWAWGKLPWDQINRPEYTVLEPERIGPLSMTWSEVFAGQNGILAITGSGAVYEFDSNPMRPRLVPLPAPALTGSCGNSTRAALTRDGILWMWGKTTDGQLGNYRSAAPYANEPFPSWDPANPPFIDTPVQVGVNPDWKLPTPVRGIPVPFHRDSIRWEDLGTHEVEVSRGSDLFTWRVLSGDGEGGTADGSPPEARFELPRGMALAGGSLYVAEEGGSIRRILLPSGAVSTLTFPDTAPALNDPISMASTSAGVLFVLERAGSAIRQVVPRSGTPSPLTTVIDSQSLDGSTPEKTPFAAPSGIAVAPSGTLYVSDTGNGVIRRIAPGASSAPILAGSPEESGFRDGPGTSARFSNPTGLALFEGTLYVADSGNHAIRRILIETGSVTTVAGFPPGQSPAENTTKTWDGVGSGAQLYNPAQLAVDSSGTLTVTEPDSRTVRRITPDGRVTTVGGIAFGYSDGEEDSSKVTALSGPFGVTVHAGTVYISDTTWIRAGTPPAVSPLRTRAQVSLVNFNFSEFPRTPRVVPSGGTLSLSAGSTTQQPGVTYQWTCNGTLVAGPGGLDTTLTAPASGWYALVARAGSAAISAPPIPVCIDNPRVTLARSAMAQGNFALAAGTLSATSRDGTELLLRSLLDLYGFLNEAQTRTALGTLGVTISGTLANGWVDPWGMQLNGRLKNLSAPAPTAALKAVLTGSTANSLHSKLEAADANLSTLTDKNFVTILRSSDLGRTAPDTDPIVVDYGDIQFARALLQAAMAALKWAEMQNTDVDLLTLLVSSQNGRLSLESLLARYPALLSASATGTTAQTAFEGRMKDALRSYQAFSDFVNPASGHPARMVQNLGIFTLESDHDRAQERVYRDAVNKALDSINANTAPAGVRTVDLGGGRISPPLSPRAFVKHTPGWRAELPRFQKNRYISNSLNLGTLRSLYPNLRFEEVARIESSRFLSEAYWNELLGTREDDAAPVLSLSTALNAGLKSSDGFVEIRGTASDASGVDSVRITLGATGDTYDAQLEELAPSDTGLRQYAWSLTMPLPATLQSGSLRFRLAAQDVLGGKMESPLERSALVLRMVPVSQSSLGKGAITLTPAPDADGLVVAGTSMLMTATPAAGSLLRRIELVVDGEAQPNQTVKTTSGGTLRFTVTAPTDLLAVFEVNPYPLLGGRNRMVGGLLEPPFGSQPFFGPLMSIQCTVTSSGEFSGKLFVGRQASSFKGSFDEDGRGFPTPTAQAWLPYSPLWARDRFPMAAALSLWIDNSDETAPALYAGVGIQSARLTPLATVDYTGPMAFTGMFGQAEHENDWLPMYSGLGDGSPRSGGFVSILPRTSGGFSLAGVLPSGEKISASGFLSGQFRGEAAFADQPAQLGDFSKIELLTPTGLQGATALSGTLSVPADASKTRAFLGSVRRENWLSLTRGPKYATGPNVSPKAYAAEWTVGAVGFTPASPGRVVAPFARNSAPSTSSALPVRVKSPADESLPEIPAFFLSADTRNRLISALQSGSGITAPSGLLNPLNGVFNGSFREAGKAISVQGVLLQSPLPAGTNLPFTLGGAGYTSDGRAVVLGVAE